jgi:hypothetical protein
MKLSYSVVKDLYNNLHSFDIPMKELVKKFLKDKVAIKSYMEDLTHDIVIADGDIDMTSYKKALVEFAEGLQRKFTITPVNPADKLPWDYEVTSIEIDYLGDKSPIMVGTIRLANTSISPNHGYYPNHPTGKKLQKFAESIRFDFND